MPSEKEKVYRACHKMFDGCFCRCACFSVDLFEATRHWLVLESEEVPSCDTIAVQGNLQVSSVTS